MRNWALHFVLRLSAPIPPVPHESFPKARFGLRRNKSLPLLYMVENREADFAIYIRYLRNTALHIPILSLPSCFCSLFGETAVL